MEGDDYSFPVDIYSCSMLIYELCTGTVPFSTSDKRLQNYVAFILAVSMGERPRVDRLPVDAAGKELSSIIEASWDGDPAQRPTASALVQRLRCVPGWHQ